MSKTSIFLATHLLFFTSSLIASLLFYFWSRPRRLEIGITLAGGVGLTFWLGLVGEPYAKVMLFLAYWSACALLVSFFVPFFVLKNRNKRVSTLELMIVPPLFNLLAAVLLSFLNRLLPSTLDYYLYAFDSSFGYPPGFLAVRLLRKLGWLRVFAEAAYINLTLALSIGYLLQRTALEQKGGHQKFVKFILFLAVTGFLFYIVFPAVGTEVMFHGTLPPPRISTVAMEQMPDLGEPRNCIPSLHTAWGLALWWTCPKRPWIRLVMGIYIGLVFLYTLSCGHYLVDMIAALPFALSVYALTRKTEGEGWACSRPAASSGAIFIAWLIMLRYGVSIFQLSPIIPWVISVATIVYCHFLRRAIDSECGTAVPRVRSRDF